MLRAPATAPIINGELPLTFTADGCGAYYDKDGFFSRVGAIGVSIGLEWGGNWKSIVDKPHFQLPDWGSSTSGIKKEFKTPEEFMKTWKEEEKVVEGWQKDVNSWWYQNFSNLLIYRGKMFFF